MQTRISISPVPHVNLKLWMLALSLIVVLGYLLSKSEYHLILAIVIGSSILAISRSDKQLSILLMMAYLYLMGDVRRLASIVATQPAYDPLLLVGPVFAAVLALPVLLHLKLRDSLSKAMLALLVIMLLEIVNPAQGGISVGLSGAYFYVPPMLWFWVGTRYASPALIEKLLYRVMIPIAAIAAILGLYQTFVGFPFYQQTWIDSVAQTYSSLYVGTSVRAFGFSISASEYAALLVFGVIIVLAAFISGKKIWIIFFPLMITSLFLASGRGVIFRLVLTLPFLWVLRKGKKLKASSIVAIVSLAALSLVLLSFGASQFFHTDDADGARRSAAQNAISHQVGGLANPLNKKYSTAGIHTDMAIDGLMRGFKRPLGSGLGSTTFASQKISGDNSQGSSEIDVVDMFTGLGVLGGVVYIIVIGCVLRSSLLFVRTTPRNIGLPVAGMILCTSASWLIGGNYSITVLLFFLFGGLVYQSNRVQREGHDSHPNPLST
jgi:hypothetical protein